MVRRLVLGCGSLGHAVVDAIAGWRGDLLVIEADAERVEALREENVPAERADPTDPAALGGVEGPVAVVLVAGDDPRENRKAAAAAAERLPGATLVVYTGRDPAPDDREAMAAAADDLLDYGPVVAAPVLDLLGGEAGERLRRLRRVLRGVEGTLGVFMHDNPDPDAIASAVALCEIAEGVGTDAEPCYFGNISHQENRAFINLLDLDLHDLEPDEYDPEAYGAIALVDHSRPGVNDQLPTETPVAIVIDHHPPSAPVEAAFVDLRSDVGATSTLLAEYLHAFGTEVSGAVATALLYGIRVDTKDFTREITAADFEAATMLLPHADVDVLERVESPQIAGETFDIIARAIRERRLYDSLLVSCVGSIRSRDALAQAADRLLAMEGVTISLVFGFRDGVVYLSGRSRRSDLDLGEAMRIAFGQIGSAGGHADMAGAQLPLGILGAVEEASEQALSEVVGDVIGGRFVETVEGLLGRPFEPADRAAERATKRGGGTFPPEDLPPGAADGDPPPGEEEELPDSESGGDGGGPAAGGTAGPDRPAVDGSDAPIDEPAPGDDG